MLTWVVVVTPAGIPISSSVKQESDLILSFPSDEEMEIEWSEELHAALGTLWEEQGIQAAFQRCNEFQQSDSTE